MLRYASQKNPLEKTAQNKAKKKLPKHMKQVYSGQKERNPKLGWGGLEYTVNAITCNFVCTNS
jgi:hypothetical protein